MRIGFGIIAGVIGCTMGLNIKTDDKAQLLVPTEGASAAKVRSDTRVDAEQRSGDEQQDVAINVVGVSNSSAEESDDHDSDLHLGATATDSSPSDSRCARFKKRCLYTGGCIALTAAVGYCVWVWRCGFSDWPGGCSPL